jgi:hypothetical protein
MKKGDLVKLAKWCKNGPVLMQVAGVGPTHIRAIFLDGPLAGKETHCSSSNLFTLEGYDEAMTRHDEKYKKP